MPRPPKFKGLKNAAKRIRNAFKRKKPSPLTKSRREPSRIGAAFKNRIPKGLAEFDFRQMDGQWFARNETRLRWVLIVLAIYLLAQLTSSTIVSLIKPSYLPIPKRGSSVANRKVPTENYDSIENRNIFNMEGTIPSPFEPSLLDCFEQARPSREPIELLGTIVMSDEDYSVALVTQRGGKEPLGVKKSDVFFDNYIAMKVDRKRLCFQVRSTQELETIEIAEDAMAKVSATLSNSSNSSSGGINVVSDNEYKVKRSFLDEKLLNLNEVLQTARAIPYMEPGTGKMKGFLIQAIDPNSPFAELGFRPGDILTNINNINMDNAGKGLEAFQALRNTSEINLTVLRGGTPKSIKYQVN